ncbi:molecular chaperone DnaK [Acrocarpospora pleiomorpha]|uniref:Molecular chaperone DnaK n=1 Tax=Acrocarpospora pleiomorpha TaxID=90975 RepID=A0A5M3XYW5_9ACTN|nr:TraR/DksA C4-type zinc finger protein [Acrocarpospora pleiomorpha]GES24653.1 molecular chaperone DnaK [Acrocarpospora pleiomorpha]
MSDTGLSRVQTDAIAEELREQHMWRTSRLQELHTLVETTEGDGDLRQRTLADLAATERAIAEIEKGLARLSERDYGQCEDCGTSIPYERLKIRPLTRHCMPCRRAHESR